MGNLLVQRLISFRNLISELYSPGLKTGRGEKMLEGVLQQFFPFSFTTLIRLSIRIDGWRGVTVRSFSAKAELSTYRSTGL